MKKRWVCIALTVACLAFTLAPVPAIATSAKRSTVILGMSPVYVTALGAKSMTVTGRIAYRKVVTTGGKKHTIDALFDGGLYLFKRNDPTNTWVKTAWTRASHGSFGFSVNGGSYQVRFVSTAQSKATMRPFEVFENVLSIHNMHASSASHDASGDAFVTLSIDFGAPSGMLTTSTPGIATILWASSDSHPMYGDIFYRSNRIEQLVTRDGTHHYGFDVPASQLDSVVSVHCSFGDPLFWVAPTSASTTFKPSDLLP